MDAYSKLLLDPRWQKKRLEVMNRDAFSCLNCGDSKSTLNVHHKKYIFGNDPWDYPMDNFETLCVDCHKNEHQKNKPNPLIQNDFSPKLIPVHYTDPERAKYLISEIDNARIEIGYEEGNDNRFECVVGWLNHMMEMEKELKSMYKFGGKKG